MAKKVIKTTFQLRRGYSDTYAQKDITLAAGEPAFELDTGRLKIGDGETSWNNLAYINDKEFVYKPGGSRGTLPELNDSNIGYVYNITEDFDVNENFIEYDEEKEKYYPAGTDVTIIKIGETLYYNVYGGFVDLSGYATKDELNSKQSILDAQKGILIDNENKIKLEEPFYNYLVKQTFIKPTIAEFAITGLGGAAEIGKSVTVTGFTHRETNPGNIKENTFLTLKKGNDELVGDITPTENKVSVTFGSPIEVTSTTSTKVIFTLSGKDALNEDVKASIEKEFYVPKIYGVSENDTVTAGELENRTRMAYKQKYENPTKVVLQTEGYIFFAAIGTVTVINTDTTYPVPVTKLENKMLSINDVNIEYQVYRTAEKLLPQTLNLKITVS